MKLSKLFAAGLMLRALDGAEGYSQSIPEPPLIIYGTVLNVQGTTNILWNFGTLTWTFQPASGLPIVITNALTNINDQFSYLLEVPCESFASGSTFSPNVIRLSVVAGDSSVSYTRSVVIDGTTPASLVPPASTIITLRPRDRGRVERVDLRVSVPLIDGGLECGTNGLPDTWEKFYFGSCGIDPFGDDDLDGISNRDEFASGTNPKDPNSFLQFISVIPDPEIGVHVEWSSALGKYYVVERSTSLTSGFAPLTGTLLATPPRNSYHDASATGPSQYFYRIRLDR